MTCLTFRCGGRLTRRSSGARQTTMIHQSIRRRTSLLATILFGVVVSGNLSAQEVVATPLSVMHPLVGFWKAQASQGCYEVYELRPDGTKLTRSSEERNEAVFEISPASSFNGFYKWTDKIVAGNQRPDCNGQVATIGHIATSYVRMHPDRTRFLLCREPRQQSCFAEFTRTDERVK